MEKGLRNSLEMDIKTAKANVVKTKERQLVRSLSTELPQQVIVTLDVSNDYQPWQQGVVPWSVLTFIRGPNLKGDSFNRFNRLTDKTSKLV